MMYIVVDSTRDDRKGVGIVLWLVVRYEECFCVQSLENCRQGCDSNRDELTILACFARDAQKRLYGEHAVVLELAWFPVSALLPGNEAFAGTSNVQLAALKTYFEIYHVVLSGSLELI